MVSSLSITPITLREARVWVDRVHRHHRAPVGGLFAIGLSRNDEIVGVAIVGRPVARRLDNSWTAEVTRVAVIEGVLNGVSKLYGACWRAARAMGYRKLVTYILTSEPGTSVRAAGWRCVGKTKGASWNVPSRPRVDLYPLQDKFRFEISL